MTAIKRYTLGERITGWPAQSWNEIADRVEAPDFVPNLQDTAGGDSVIGVRNTSAVLIPQGGVMQPTGAMLAVADGIAAVNQGPLLGVDVPDLDAGAESTYMIAVAPINPGLVGGGLLMGPVWVKVDIRDTNDKYAQVIDDDATQLESTASGSRARIIAQETGTGEKWCLVLLAPYRLRIRKGIVNNSNPGNKISAGTEGTVDVYLNGSNTGEENTVNLDWLHGDNIDTQDISTDIRVVYADFEDENKFTIIVADCEPQDSPAPPGHGNDINLTTETAGTAQVGSHQLSFKSNRILESTATNNSVMLLSGADQEQYCQIRNDDGADAVLVWPVVGGFINGQSVNTSESLAAGAGRIYTQVEADHWISS